MEKGPITTYIEHHYRHFNAATLIDASKAYNKYISDGGKMMITLAGAMSTGEIGLSLAEMIRENKVQIISCTGANLEEDVMNLVAHDHYKRVPNYRDLTPKEEWGLLQDGFNRVTDTCIPEEEAFRRIQHHIFKIWNIFQIKRQQKVVFNVVESLILKMMVTDHNHINFSAPYCIIEIIGAGHVCEYKFYFAPVFYLNLFLEFIYVLFGSMPFPNQQSQNSLLCLNNHRQSKQE